MHFLKTRPIGLAVAFFAVMFVACSSEKVEPTTASKSFEAMNTFMTVKSFGPNASAVNDSVEEMIEDLESKLSTTLQGSDIYRVNHGEGGNVSEKTRALATFALKMAQETEGALNPVLYPIVHLWGFTTEKYRVPADSEIAALLPYTDYRQVVVEGDEIKMAPNMMMDLGAVGKGFAGDEAIKLMKRKGITSAILDLGGNVQTLGCKDNGKPWKVGITNPWGGAPIGGLTICGKSVITSGGYERFFEEAGKRYIHIFNGTSGRPVENELSSVTIVAESGLLADALSTSLFVMGVDKAIEFWKKNRDKFQIILLLEDKTMVYSAPLESIMKVTYPLKNRRPVQ